MIHYGYVLGFPFFGLGSPCPQEMLLGRTVPRIGTRRHYCRLQNSLRLASQRMLPGDTVVGEWAPTKILMMVGCHDGNHHK